MRRVLLAVLCAASCSKGGPPRARHDAGAARAAVPEAPPYGRDVASLRLRRSIVVRIAPDAASKPLGTVAQDTRVAWRRAAAGPGCPRWIEIEPRGWVCDKYLEPSRKPPAGVELPKLKPGEIVPGTYGRVSREGARAYAKEADVAAGKVARELAGMVTVRKLASKDLAGRAFWKTSSGEWIEAARIAEHEPSTFRGVDAPTLPLAWAQAREDHERRVPVHDGPDAGARVVRKLPARTVVTVVEDTPGAARVRIGAPGARLDGAEWIARADLRIARASARPPSVEPGERWLDVDLDEQVVVAWQDDRAAFATLVSSGARKWPTEEGLYRIWIKFAETDMNGQMGDEQPYSVATVPWTMFFSKDLAFHTAYWHDKFGEARSHGCLNLAPRDARELYFWATPDVPPGWSMAHGVVERPGSLVRIRSAAVPDPPFRGYAKRVAAARGIASDALGPEEPSLPVDSGLVTP